MWTDAKEEILMDAVSVCKDLKEANDRLWTALWALLVMNAVTAALLVILCLR